MTDNITDSIKRAVGVLKTGGIIAYPTETVYGLGCDPFNKSACERIQLVKGRDDHKPFLLLSSSLEQVEQFAGKLTGSARILADAFWPGPLTMVVVPSGDWPDYLKGDSGGIAFRVTPHHSAALIAHEFGRPIISTSANVTGGQPVMNYKDALETFGNSVDLIIESELSLQGEPSTVVDVTTGNPVLLREGAIKKDRILEVI